MTPKEKAEDLFNKMDMIIYTDSDWKSQCKRCALIAVDEILQYDINPKCERQFVIQRRIEEYWQQVKNEIEKL